MNTNTFAIGDEVTLTEGAHGNTAYDIEQYAFIGTIVQLPHSPGGMYEIMRPSSGNKAGQTWRVEGHSLTMTKPATPPLTAESLADPSDSTDAPDTANINGKEYRGWWCFNDTAFKAVVKGGLTRMVNIHGVNDFRSMNPVPR